MDPTTLSEAGFPPARGPVSVICAEPPPDAVRVAVVYWPEYDRLGLVKVTLPLPCVPV